MHSRKGSEEPAAQVYDIVAALLEHVAVHRSEFPLPTAKDALQGMLGIHEFPLNLCSYFIGEGDIPEHLLMSAEDFRHAHFEFPLDALSRQAQVAEDLLDGALDARILFIDLFHFDIVHLQIALEDVLKHEGFSLSQTRGYGCTRKGDVPVVRVHSRDRSALVRSREFEDRSHRALTTSLREMLPQRGGGRDACAVTGPDQVNVVPV